MDIIFYKLQDEVNDVKKLRTLTAREDYTPLQVSGTLKGATSKVAPSIDFSKPVTYFNGYNYCYIADFNRYYFVTDIISNRNDYSTVDLRVDVLTSFLTQSNMGNLEGFVGRCSNGSLYNKTIPDKLVQFKTGNEITVFEPTLPSSYVSSENVVFSLNASYNILISTTFLNVSMDLSVDTITVPYTLTTLVGSSTISGEYFRPKGATYIYVSDVNEFTYDGSSVGVFKTMKIILYEYASRDDAQSFVNSVMVFPFTIPHTDTYKDFYVNDDRIQLVGGGYLQCHSGKGFNSGFLVLKDFVLSIPNYNDSFTDYEPYKKCELYVPYLGWIDINLKNHAGSRIIVYYNVDYVSGKGNAYVYDYTKNVLITQSPVKLGVEVPINTTNMRENELKDQNYTRNYFAGMLTSLTMGAIGAATLNPYMAVAGASGVIMTSTQYINNENLLLDKASNPAYNTDGISGSISGLKVLVRFTSLTNITYNSSTEADYIDHNGLPTNKMALLSAIPRSNKYHTYAEITDLHTTSENGLYSLGDITLNETEELKTLCSQGIYL